MKLLSLFQYQLGLHELTYEGETVREIIDKFVDEYGESLDKTLLDPKSKKLQHYILILVNGRNIQFLKGLDTPLKDDDVIAITPPIAGGTVLLK